jgi:hypothetical protein
MIHVIAASVAAHNATQQATNAAIMAANVAANAANQASKLSKDAEDEDMEFIIGIGIVALIVIALALMSYFWDDTLKNALHDFIEWTCSFNGTFDIKAFFGIK